MMMSCDILLNDDDGDKKGPCLKDDDGDGEKVCV